METDVAIEKGTKLMVECPCQDPEKVAHSMVECPICKGKGRFKAKVYEDQTVWGYIEDIDDIINDLDPPPRNEGYE